MNRPCRFSRRSSGFATFVAVALIAMVGTALLSLTLLLSTDVRRTSRHRAETQLRQLLIAGGVAAEQAVAADPSISGSRTIAVPGDSDTTSLRVTYETPTQSALHVTISATTDDYKARQVMRYALVDSVWVLRGVEL